MPKIESLVVYAMPDIPSKFQKDSSITFRVILLTHRQTNNQTKKNRQKHYLLGRGNYLKTISFKKCHYAFQVAKTEPICHTSKVLHTRSIT